MPSGIRAASNIVNPEAMIPGWRDVILGDADVAWWGTADADGTCMALSSGDQITQWKDRKGNAGTMDRPSGTSYATLVPDVFNGYAGAQFTTAEADRYQLNNITFDTEAEHSMIFIGSLPLLLSQHGILGRFSSTTSRNHLYRAANSRTLEYRRGTATVGLPISYDEPMLAMTGYDLSFDKLQVNRTRADDVVAAGSGASGSAFVLGAFGTTGSGAMTGKVADIILVRADIFDDSKNILKQAIRSYAQLEYGIMALD